MIRATLLSIALAAPLAGTAHAQTDPASPNPLPLCSQSVLDEQSSPSDAIAPTEQLLAALPGTTDPDGACTLPLAYLPGPADSRVLITQRFVEGGDCHGCGAVLSAHFFGAGDTAIHSHWGFATSGTFGRAGAVSGVALGRERFGVAIESESTFQGYTTTGLEIFEARDKRVVPVLPFAVIGKSDCGAVEGVCDTIEGRWQITPEGELVIRFSGIYDGKEIDLDMLVTYRLVEEGFQLIEGRVLEPY